MTYDDDKKMLTDNLIKWCIMCIDESDVESWDKSKIYGALIFFNSVLSYDKVPTLQFRFGINICK